MFNQNLEIMKKNLLKITKGILILFTLKFMLLGSGFLFQSCTKENQNIENIDALLKYKNALQKERSKIEYIKEVSSMTHRDNLYTEEEAKQFLKPTLDASLDLIHSYGITDNEIINITGTIDSPIVVLVAMAILESQIGNDMAFDFNSIFINQVYANMEDDIGHCFLEAVGIYGLVEMFAGHVSQAAILGAFRKVAGRTLGWIGLGIAVYEFGDCMGYW